MASFSSFGYPGRLDPKHLGPVWTAIFYGVPLANLAVHLAWLLVLHPALSSLPLPIDRRRLTDFLNRNFMLRPSINRPITLITAAFSHIQPLHFFVNMSTYNTYVKTLYLQGMSPLRFIFLALGSGIAASMTYLFNARRPRTTKSNSENSERAALGTSGVLTGLGTALAVMFPKLKVRLSGTEVVLPLRVVLVGMLAVDAYCLGTERETGVGHAGHVGGALFGLAYAFGRKAMRYWTL